MKKLPLIATLILLYTLSELSYAQADRSIESIGSQQQSTQSSVLNTLQQAAVKSYNVAAPIAYATSASILKTSSEFAQETVLPYILSKLTSQRIDQSQADYTQANIDNCDKNEHSDSDINSNSDSDSDIENFTMLESTKKKKAFYRDQQELQDQLNNNPEQAINKLNQSLNSYLKEQMPENMIIQQDIFHVITLLKESELNKNKKLSINPVIADTYNDLLKTILINKVQNHALRIEPKIEATYNAEIMLATEKRDRAIAKAHKNFEVSKKLADQKRLNKLTRIFSQAKIIAHNSQYINNCASHKADHKAQENEHYESIESYKILLADFQKKLSEQHTDEKEQLKTSKKSKK